MGSYIWGSVGRGKTMLMDMFFAEFRRSGKRTRAFPRFHADAHGASINGGCSQRTGRRRARIRLRAVAEASRRESWVLCFDEFAVNDIADALIPRPPVHGSLGEGVVVVDTSNVDPQDLYKGWLNRALFMPFIARCSVGSTSSSSRRAPIPSRETRWRRRLQHACRCAGKAALDAAWRR